MSRDSNFTHVHLHASHHADLFEEFCHPPSSSSATVTSIPTAQTSASNANATQYVISGGTSSADPGMVQIPGHFLPFEEIQLPPHLMPLNPEDEDGVVPDMHAAFGIQRALEQGPGGEGSGRGVQQEPVWRDMGMERLLETGGVSGSGNAAGRVGGAGAGAGGAAGGRRREGKKSSILLMR